MITRYFVLNTDNTLVPDNDVLPLTSFKYCKVLYKDDDKTIVHVLLDSAEIADMAYITDLDNPLTIVGVAALDIAGSYIGTQYDDIFTYYPELDVTTMSGIPLVPRHLYAGQTTISGMEV
jgi:hypothetical protein